MKLLFVAASLATSVYAAASGVPLDEGCFPWNSREHSLFHPDDWRYCQRISENLYMYYTPRETTVMLGLHVLQDLHGWSALSPSGNGGMKGAAHVVVRKDDNDEWVAEDRYSHDYVTPSLDERQDVQLLFAHQDDATGETAWGVVLPQDSCDEPYDYPLEDRETHVIWALGDAHDFGFHGGDRGQFTANLLGPPPVVPDMAAHPHVDFVMPNVPVIRAEEDLDPTNAFVCSYFDLDVLGQDIGFDSDSKVHMVGYEPVIAEESKQFLHHFTLFECDGYTQDGFGSPEPVDESHLFHQKVIPACTNMPPGCQNLIGGWAVGSKGTSYPPHVGVPLGEGHRWLVLQVHYYNPNLVPDVYDSSGLRAYLTTDTRPVDAGLMSFAAGVRTGQHPPLPGGQKDVAMETLYVEPDCTSGWSGPLTVLSVQHHSHFLGTHQGITVERDGVNMGAMRKEFVFDYNHQGPVAPSTAMRTLLPGDRLVAECHFDTTSVPVNSTVNIGEESNKEMCFPTMLYYPKQERQSFAYIPPTTIASSSIGSLEWCSSPSADESFESQCAEELFQDIPRFSPLVSEKLPNGVSFDYPTLCNGGGVAEIVRKAMPMPICPDTGCTETQSCSLEELREAAKGVCRDVCGRFGLTLYPDLGRTKPYSTANIACPNTFFDPPTLAEPAECEAIGSLPQIIELTKTKALEEADFVSEFPDSSGSLATWGSFAALSFVACFFV